MNSHKKKCYLLPAQVAIARADKLDLHLSNHQCFQRQRSRFLCMVKNIFGGKKNLQQFLENEMFIHRMLQPVEPWADMKPLDKRHANMRPKGAKARNQRTYYELLAKDLMDPANATKRDTRRFSQILEAMEDARQGCKIVYPCLEGTTEASLHGGPECGPQGQGQYTQNKGKGKAAWHNIHYTC